MAGGHRRRPQACVCPHRPGTYSTCMPGGARRAPSARTYSTGGATRATSAARRPPSRATSAAHTANPATPAPRTPFRRRPCISCSCRSCLLATRGRREVRDCLQACRGVGKGRIQIRKLDHISVQIGIGSTVKFKYPYNVFVRLRYRGMSRIAVMKAVSCGGSSPNRCCTSFRSLQHRWPRSMGRLSMAGRAPPASADRAPNARPPPPLGGLRAGLGARVNIDSDDDENEGPRRAAGAVLPARRGPAARPAGERMQLSDDDDDDAAADNGAGLLRHAARATGPHAGRSPGGGWVVVAGGVHSDRTPAPQPPAALAPLLSPASLRTAPDGKSPVPQPAQDAARAGPESGSPAPTTTVAWHTPLGAHGTPPPPRV